MDLKASPSTDTHQKIYRDSHTAQLSEQVTANAVSARRILDIVMERLLG
jgi:hypothetical protein